MKLAGGRVRRIFCLGIKSTILKLIPYNRHNLFIWSRRHTSLSVWNILSCFNWANFHLPTLHGAFLRGEWMVIRTVNTSKLYWCSVIASTLKAAKLRRPICLFFHDHNVDNRSTSMDLGCWVDHEKLRNELLTSLGREDLPESHDNCRSLSSLTLAEMTNETGAYGILRLHFCDSILLLHAHTISAEDNAPAEVHGHWYGCNDIILKKLFWVEGVPSPEMPFHIHEHFFNLHTCSIPPVVTSVAFLMRKGLREASDVEPVACNMTNSAFFGAFFGLTLSMDRLSKPVCPPKQEAEGRESALGLFPA